MFVPSHRPAVIGLALLLILPSAVSATSPEHPEPLDSGPPLTLAAALARAEARHPLFASWRERLSAADSRYQQAGLRPSPELGLEVENVLGSGSLRGAEAAEITFGLSQLIERGGLRDRRLDTALAERALLDEDGAVARLDQRAEVARRFIHVLSDQAQLGITHEATEMAQSTLAEVERRVSAARAPLAERSRARVALERARLDEEHAEHELLSSRRHLAAATGALEPDFGPAQGPLLDLPPVASFESLLARLPSTPDLQRYASETRLREAELRLAQARSLRSLRLGAGVRRLEMEDDVGLVFSASLPLFGARAEQGNIAESRARLAQVAPEREQALLRLQAQLYEFWQEARHAQAEFETQRDRVVPLMDEALRHTQTAYERGRYSLLELREAQAEWASQRRRMIQSAAEYHVHLIDIQRLAGPAAGSEPTEVPTR